MKRTKQWGLHHFFYCMLAIALTIGACKKGDPGPQGEKGDKGDTGEKGNPGTKGDPGTVNVQYSAWLDLGFTSPSAGFFFTQIADNKITESMLTTGEIKVYINLGTQANKVVAPLPFVDVEESIQITPLFAPGIIEIDANINAGTVVDQTTGNKRRQYRYVLIPGGTAIRRNVNWNNYEEVKAYLGIKD